MKYEKWAEIEKAYRSEYVSLHQTTARMIEGDSFVVSSSGRVGLGHYYECRRICGHYKQGAGICRLKPKHNGKSHKYLMDIDTARAEEASKKISKKKKRRSLF